MQTETLAPTSPMKQGYLSYEESLIFGLWPSLLFLVNGIVVLTLKTIEAPSFLIVLSPALFLIISGIFLFRIYKWGCRFKPIKLLVISSISILFALWHYNFYGTSIAGDAASYFTNPFHTFFVSKHFSFSEQPFVEFGAQPLANYWIPYNAEYLVAQLTALFSGDILVASAVMHISSNFFFALAILAIVMRYLGVIQSLVISTAFFFLLYAAHEQIRDLAATSLFRGFENKGLIWGYCFWTIVNILTPPTDFKATKLASVVIGIVSGGGAFLVSGNAFFLAIPAVALVGFGLVTPSRQHVFISIISYLATLAICFLGYKLAEVTDVYNVVLSDLSFRPPPEFTVLKEWFGYPTWTWILASVLIAFLVFSNFKLSLPLLVFILVALIVQNELFFQLFYYFLPERSLNFWRGAILMSPFLPILTATLMLLKSISVKHAGAVSAVIAVTLTALNYAQVLTLPKKTPFSQTRLPLILAEIAHSCTGSSKLLADRHMGTMLAVIQPRLNILVGKEYFLNWQIANLPPESIERTRAEAVRNASRYLSKNPINRKYFEDISGLEYTLFHEKPDIIVAKSSRFLNKKVALLDLYNRQKIGKMTVFYKNNHCQFENQN